MIRWLTIAAVVVCAGLFAWAVPLVRLFDAFQPIIVALSIMVAAIFVRLNRGMPTLEWKSIEPAKRNKLTTRIVELSKEYCWIVATNGLALIVLVTMTVIGKCELGVWSIRAQQVAAGAIGGVLALCISRMAYVVWRDFDIVKLQKHLIDALAASDHEAKQNAESSERVADIRAAGLKKIDSEEPKSWGD